VRKGKGEGEGVGEKASLIVRVQPAGAEAQTITYTLALLGQKFSDDGSCSELKEQPLVGNPRLAAAYTYGYNQPLFAHRARQLAATLKWLTEEYPDATVTIEGHGPSAALAAAGAVALQGPKATAVRLQLAPDGFRFAKVDSIRDPNFLPASARYWDVPGLVSCFAGKVEIIDDDKADFEKLQAVAASHQ
jgi:hypothetical protein